MFIYLSAAVPNHGYKLVSCWFKPAWYSLLMGPSIFAHWGVLLVSQRYYFVQCACSAYGCWYPAAIIMLTGARGERGQRRGVNCRGAHPCGERACGKPGRTCR